MSPRLCNHVYIGVAERTVAKTTGSPDNNNSTSPWPEIEDGAVAFLLDARDDFEARLLRDWVEANKPETGTHLRHWFINLSRRHYRAQVAWRANRPRGRWRD